jgi:hypothetical protein
MALDDLRFAVLTDFSGTARRILIKGNRTQRDNQSEIQAIAPFESMAAVEPPAAKDRLTDVRKLSMISDLVLFTNRTPISIFGSSFLSIYRRISQII